MISGEIENRLNMTNTEKPQPMEVDQKKPEKVEEKPDEKQELVSLHFCRVIIV